MVISCVHAKVAFITSNNLFRDINLLSFTHSLLLLILFLGDCSFVCFGLLFGARGINLFVSFLRRPRSG